MKQLLKNAFRSLGVDIVTFPPPSPLAIHLRNFFNEASVDLVLDVGAFTGLFCRHLRKEVGYEGKIISFEPCRSSFQKLQNEMSGDRHWRGLNYGLSDTARKAMLNKFDSSDFNSLHQMNDRGSLFNVQKAEPEEVELKTLDAIFGDLPSSSKIFLKIDTQGHDLQVIAGASTILNRLVGILSEVPVVEIYDGTRSMPDTIQALQAIGFSPTGFYPVNFGYNGAPAEFDVIFINANRLKE